MYLIRTQEHNDTRLWQHWPAEEFYVVYRMEKKTLFEDDLYLGANAQKYRQGEKLFYCKAPLQGDNF